MIAGYSTGGTWGDDTWTGGTSGGILVFEPASRLLATSNRLASLALDELSRSLRTLGRRIDDFAVLAKRPTARVRWAADAAAIEPLPSPPPPRPVPRVRRRACSVSSRYRVAA